MDKILIVDHSLQNTTLLAECLSNGDFELMTSESGFNALAKLKVFHPDLVIMDDDLPDMSGYDLCKKIRSDPAAANTLVLILSVSDATECRFRAMSVGADDFMEKNFDSFLLMSKIRSLLRVKTLGEQLKQKYAELEEKNKLIAFQLKMGRQVQRSLLPRIDFCFNDVLFLSEYMPAMDIGGDFYSLSQIDDHTITVAIGDVSGHGIAAALITAMLNSMVKNLAIQFHNPSTLLFHLNNAFAKAFEETEKSLYACVFVATIDTRDKIIRFANAGHVQPVFVNAKRNRASELAATGIPIGMIDGSTYVTYAEAYDEGDLLLFFTDGLSDTFYKDNNEEFLARLEELLLDAASPGDGREINPREIVDILLGSFYNYNATENEKMELDDVSIILCQM